MEIDYSLYSFWNSSLLSQDQTAKKRIKNQDKLSSYLWALDFIREHQRQPCGGDLQVTNPQGISLSQQLDRQALQALQLLIITLTWGSICLSDVSSSATSTLPLVPTPLTDTTNIKTLQTVHTYVCVRESYLHPLWKGFILATINASPLRSY